MNFVCMVLHVILVTTVARGGCWNCNNISTTSTWGLWTEQARFLCNKCCESPSHLSSTKVEILKNLIYRTKLGDKFQNKFPDISPIFKSIFPHSKPTFSENKCQCSSSQGYYNGKDAVLRCEDSYILISSHICVMSH